MEDWRSKLSADTVAMIERAAAGPVTVPDQLVRVLVQLVHPLDGETEKRLRDAGLTIQGRAGTIVTARLAPNDLEPVASLEEVKYLQLAQPLFIEKS
jgi:hypothetical protein